MDTDLRLKALYDFLKDDPRDATAKYMLALEFIKMGNDVEAAKWMEDLHSNHADYLPNYYHFGKLLERNNDPERASEIYEKGMEVALKAGDNHTLNELRGALENQD